MAVEIPSADEIKKARKDAGVTLGVAAALAGASVSTWTDWEYGIRDITPANWALFKLRTTGKDPLLERIGELSEVLRDIRAVAQQLDGPANLRRRGKLEKLVERGHHLLREQGLTDGRGRVRAKKPSHWQLPEAAINQGYHARSSGARIEIVDTESPAYSAYLEKHLPKSPELRGIEDRWLLVCTEHKTTTTAAQLKPARAERAHPERWCAGCKEAVKPRGKVLG